MFERFTDRARRVVVLAQEEARLLGHPYIGTEHLLLGLAAEEHGIAARVLDEVMGLDGWRAAVVLVVGRGDAPTSAARSWTPRGKKALEFALRAALTLGHNYIGTEHLLLGLLRVGDDCAAARTLEAVIGVDADALRGRTLAMTGERPTALIDGSTRAAVRELRPERTGEADLGALVDRVREATAATQDALDGLHVALARLRDAVRDQERTNETNNERESE